MFRRLFRNRWVRGSAITVFVFLLVVTLVSLNGYYTLRHQGEQHQARVLAELDATDPGWRWEQIQTAREQDQPPPEQNVIEQAAKLADRIPRQQYWEWFNHQPQLPDTLPTPGDLPTEDELAHARKLTNMCRDLIPDARELRHLTGTLSVQPGPQSDNPFGITFPQLDKIGQVDTLLRNSATVSAADGKINDALDDVLAVIALARGLDDSPFLVVQLFRLRYLINAVRLIERVLRQGNASDAKLAEVQAALAGAAKVKGYVAALRGERASMSKLADLLKKDPRNVEGLLPGQPPPPVVTSVATSALLPGTHARYLELMTRAIAIADKPPGPDRNAEFAQIEADLKVDVSLEGEALKLVLPAIVKCYDTDVRTVALLEVAVAGIAFSRLLAEPGVVKRSPPLPDDPFTGKPVCFKKFPDGVAIYSTGPDGKDDGGTNLTDGGTKPGFDWGVRLYDGKHR